MRYQNVLETIGNTPCVRINKLFGSQNEVWLKLERANPGGSIKDRIALSMIEAAERDKIISAGVTTVVEPTSGNTGVGLAMVCAVKGYKLILVMPDSMTIERRKMMTAYGATLILTPKEQGMKGSIAKAQEIISATPNSWMPMQFDNPANPAIHERTTAEEIAKDFPDGVSAIITGMGTGGHITGCATVLKKRWSTLKVFAVEPDKSTLLAGGTHAPHRIQGIAPGFIPKIMRPELLDGTVAVSEERAFEFARRCATEEGICVGISSGATLAAIDQALKTKMVSGRVLGFCYDTGERYLSIEGLFPS